MIIDFSNKNVVSRVEDILKEGTLKVKESENGITWDEVNEPLDWVAEEITKVYGVASHLNSVMYEEESAEEFENTIPIVTDFYNKMGSNKKLYEAYVALERNEELNDKQKYILSEGKKGFYLGGIELSPRGQEVLSRINNELGVLKNNFQKNCVQATDEWMKEVILEDLEGVGTEGLKKFEEGGKYKITLHAPVYIEAMTYVNSRELREEIYNAYMSRATGLGITSEDYNNDEIMKEILRLRQEKARLLGFSNYAELSLYCKMVEKPEDVVVFLDELVSKSKKQAKIEFKELCDFSGIKLKPWDLMYYSNKLKEHKYEYKNEELTKYFPEEKVIDSINRLVSDMYGITFEDIDEETYHEDVRVLLLKGKNGDVVGKIYLDAYARDKKRGGAWMDDYQTLDGEKKPIAYVVCNFNKGEDGSYYEVNDIVTLYHEFGHALHHILTKCEYPSVAGISGVPWDGVELPSQYMENYAYEFEVMESMSEHKETGKKIPKDLYDKVISSKNFLSAMGMLRQCEFSLWDIKMHMGEGDAYSVLQEVSKETSLMKKEEGNRFLNTFSHIYAGGYAAGYYSYKWAEVLASDAYEYASDSKEKKTLFKQHILEIGGSKDFMKEYIKFRGKTPSTDSLLKYNGIAN